VVSQAGSKAFCRKCVVVVTIGCTCACEGKEGSEIESKRQPLDDGDVADVFPLNEGAVMGRSLPTELSMIVNWTVVRSNPFDRSCLVVYTSRPICMQTMMMMIAGYMLEMKSMIRLTTYEPAPGRTMYALNRYTVQRRQYTKPDSIRSPRAFSTRSEVLPVVSCALTVRRYSHAFQAMRDVDKIFVPSIGPTIITASLP